MNKSINRINIKMIIHFSKPFRWSFSNLFICVIVTSFVGMMYPYIFGLLVDQVFYHRNMDFFKFIIIGYGVLYIGEQLLHLILNSTWAYLMTRFLFDIRSRIFNHTLFLKSSYLSNTHTGDLITRINKDADEFMNFIHWNVFFLFANIIRLILSIVLVAMINLKIAGLMIIIVPISVYTSRYFAKQARVLFEKSRKEYGKYISWLLEILSGIREIQLLAGERNIVRSFVRSYSGLVRTKIRSSLIEVAAERGNTLITLLFSLVLYTAAAFFIIRGELTVGGFIAVIDYYTRSCAILNGLNEANLKIKNNMVSISKVVHLLEEDSEKTEGRKKDIHIPDGRIEFQGVSFQYNPHMTLLNNIQLVINQGERISFVGKSGAGKSTLVNLLLRLYDIDKGSITIDDQDIRQVSLKSLRRGIGVVQQEALLFEGTIQYNLKLGNPKCTEAEIWEACEKAHIADHIRSLPLQLQTVIGHSEGGTNLSGGQRQRLAIARIYLKNPKILIFDEATSALDYEAEKFIQKAWKELSYGRTTVVIAHRLSTIIESDRVALVKDGKIVSCDHHAKLLEGCQYYRELFNEQYVNQEEAAI